MAQRDLFSQACWWARKSRRALYVGLFVVFFSFPQSTIPKVTAAGCARCLLPCCHRPSPSPLTRLPHPTRSDLLTLGFSQFFPPLSRLDGRACGSLLADARGLGQDGWSGAQFAEHVARKDGVSACEMPPRRFRSVPFRSSPFRSLLSAPLRSGLCCAAPRYAGRAERTVADMPKGVTWLPRGA